MNNQSIARSMLLTTLHTSLYISDAYMRTELTIEKAEYYDNGVWVQHCVETNRIRRLVCGIRHNNTFEYYGEIDELTHFLADYVPVAIIGASINGKLEKLTYGIEDEIQRQIIDVMRYTERELLAIENIRSLFLAPRVNKRYIMSNIVVDHIVGPQDT